MLWQLLLIVLVIIYLKWRLNNWRILKLASQIKCDYRTLPIFGHLYLFKGNGVDRMKGFELIGRESIKQGGLTNFWSGPYYYLVISDPVVVDIISKACLEKGDIMRIPKLVTGNGTIFATVPIWRPRRKVLAPTFSHQNLKSFVEIFSQQSSVMVKHLKSMEGKNAFSIWQFLSTYSMDSICETTLGVKVNAQTQHEHPFLKAFEQTSSLLAERMLVFSYHIDVVYSLLPQYEHFINAKKVLHEFVSKIIVSKQKSMEMEKITLGSGESQSSNEGHNTFLQQLLESRDVNGYSNEELQEETLMLIIAGSDTSSVGAAFTSVMLSWHPEVQEKVYQELHELCGESETMLTAEDLLRLKYLDAVIRETLRLYPPAPVILRTVEKDVDLPSGLTLVPGCNLLLNIWALHRNPEYWGADADQFRPERFLDSTPKHPAAFIPFSYGPRNCLGYQFAMMSMKTALSSLLRNYRVLPATPADENGKHPPLRLTFDIMMRDADKFLLRLEPRKIKVN